MNKAQLIGLGFLIMLSGCTQRMICPAYQSAFIYDKNALKKKFSYFREDSTPRIFTASTGKNKYLVAVPESYRKKYRSLQTIEMKPVYPEIPDSLKLNEGEDLILAERDVIDSTGQQPSQGIDPSDSAYAITKTKEKYNIEQDNYMWYFRNTLVLPDVRAAMEEKKNAKNEKGGSAKSKKKGGFFKNLFKKKEKKKDSTDVSSPPLEQNDSTAASKPKQKSGGLFKKKAKTVDKKTQPDKKKGDAKKEDEDDGF
jgi:hypothetical protein